MIRAELMSSCVQETVEQGADDDSYAPWLDSNSVDADELMWFMDHVEHDLNGCRSAASISDSHFDSSENPYSQEVFEFGRHRVYISDVSFETKPSVEVDDGSGWRRIEVLNFD